LILIKSILKYLGNIMGNLVPGRCDICGGSAPEVPQEQKDLAKTQADIAKQEWGFKEPGLEMMQSWSQGGAIPSYMMPDFSKLLAEGQDIFGKLSANVKAAYAPEEAAIEKYYGPAMTTPQIETIQKEASQAKEQTAGYAGLPSQTARSMENIQTQKEGAIAQVQTVANLAKAGAEVAFQGKLGTAQANIDQALANFQLSTEQQMINFEPNLRMGALQGMVSGQFVNPEAQFAQASSSYANAYQQDLQRYQTNEYSQLSWISTFAKLGESFGEAAGGYAALAAL
jgi:hypothetical protein